MRMTAIHPSRYSRLRLWTNYSFPKSFRLALGLCLVVSAAFLDLRAQPNTAGTIEGRVLNTRNGDYVEKARVTIEGVAPEVFTGSDGFYRFTNVPAGPATLRAFFTGLEVKTQTVIVPVGGTVQSDFNLTASHRGETGRDPETVRLSEVVVSATREMDGAAVAINVQRFAPNIVNAVAAGEFGSVAEGNVGEFLKFLPGIAIGYVGGETRTASINGVPSGYVPITIGGFDLSSAASSTTSRQVEFEQVSINSLSRIEILQSPTPESPGSALAGSVNMVPRSAFEQARARFDGRVFVMMRSSDNSLGKTGGSLDNPTRTVFPGFEFSYVNPVNRRFGFTLSGGSSTSYMRQDSIINTWAGASVATNGTSLPGTSPDKPYLSQVLIKDDPKLTHRSSVGGTVDFKLTTYDQISCSLQYSFYDSTFGGGVLTFLPNTIAQFTTTSTQGAAGAGEVRNERAAREKAGTTYMPTLTYRHDGKVWKTEAGAGLSHSTNHYDNIAKGNFGNAMARRTGVTIAFADISARRPGQVLVTQGTTGVPVDFTNLNSYALSQFTANQADTSDLQAKAFANLHRHFDWHQMPIALKGGFDVRHARRDLRGEVPTWNFVGPDARTSTTPVAGDDNVGSYGVLDNYFSQRALPFGFSRMQYADDAKLWELYKAHPDYFALDANATYRNAISRSKLADEVVSAAYLRGDVALFNGRLKFIGGVRVEQTNVKAEGQLNDPTLNYQRNASGSIVRGSDGRPLLIVPTTNTLGVAQLTLIERGQRAEKEYLRLFPSLNASYLIRDHVIARASYYWSVGRPDFNQYAGGITVPDTSAPPSPNNLISVNNAGIKDWSARTTKVRLEYYFEGVGQVSVGGFVRDFENFFGNTILPATPELLALYSLDPAQYGAYEVSTQYNLPGRVRMTGVEFDYKQALTFLPHWARGVQVFGNATAVRATGQSASQFTGLTPRVMSAGISLSRAKFNVKTNWNYRSLQRGAAINGQGIEAGTYNWTPPLRFLDVQGEYMLGTHFALFATLRNLRNTPTTMVQRYGPNTPGYARLFQRTEDGASLWTVGVKGGF